MTEDSESGMMQSMVTFLQKHNCDAMFSKTLSSLIFCVPSGTQVTITHNDMCPEMLAAGR